MKKIAALSLTALIAIGVLVYALTIWFGDTNLRLVTFRMAQ